MQTKIENYFIDDVLQIESLMNDYTNYILTIIRNFSLNLSEEDIEEIMLDVFLTIWNNQENFKEEYENNTLNYEVTDNGLMKLKDDAKFYKTDERVRKVWCVVVQYDLNNFVSSEFTYFVDCTTGEIIGGTRSNNLIEDEYLYKK